MKNFDGSFREIGQVCNHDDHTDNNDDNDDAINDDDDDNHDVDTDDIITLDGNDVREMVDEVVAVGSKQIPLHPHDEEKADEEEVMDE